VVASRAVVVACAALAGCNAVFGIEGTGLVNDNPRTLVFDNSASRVDLVEFPTLVVLDAQRIDYTAVQNPATDLRFHAPAEDVDLPFEIEHWNPDGESFVWVRVPFIAAGSRSDSIQMYFGPDAGGAAAPSAVWSDYEVVLHGEPGSYTSPTPSAPLAKATAITSAPGRVGSAFKLVGDGNDHSIDLPGTLLDGWPTFTLEMWIYLDYASSTGYRNPGPEPQFVDKPGDGIRLGRIFDAANISFLFLAQLDTQYAGAPGTQFAGTYLRIQRWAHLLWTFDGRTQWLYRDGDFSDISNLGTTTTLIAGNSPLVLGSHNDPINGMLDEVRVSRAYRDPDWVLAQYLAMTDRFITFPRPGEML
jgi:hypothetical protein